MAEVRLHALPALGTAHSVGSASIGCKARICGRLALVMWIIACASAALSPDCTCRKGVSTHRVVCPGCAARNAPCAAYVRSLLQESNDWSWLAVSRVRWVGLQLHPDCTSRKGASSHRVVACNTVGLGWNLLCSQTSDCSDLFDDMNLTADL